MKGFGFEDCIKLLYPDFTDQIVSGNAYYKALRAHFMIDASLIYVVYHNVYQMHHYVRISFLRNLPLNN